MRSEDSKGNPLLIWDHDANRVLVSSLLPSWEDFEEVGEQAYNLLYGLYGREDAEVLAEAPIRELANLTSRSALRTAELAHQTARRGLQSNRRLRELGATYKELEEKLAAMAEELAGSKAKEVVLPEVSVLVRLPPTRWPTLLFDLC